MKHKNRVSELDGLRGIAIILVILFHYFQRYTEFYPFGSDVLPWAERGYLGVQLFFIISGFVIAFTLSRQPNLLSFTRQRVLRLWPAMGVCSCATFAMMHSIDNPFTLQSRVGIDGFVPSLTFTAPFIWEPLLGSTRYIDGAYWSLFVEVRFYFWSFIVAYSFGTRNLGLAFLVCMVALTSVDIFAETNGAGAILRKILEVLFFTTYLPLFTIGILTFECFNGRTSGVTTFGLPIALAAAMIHAADALEAATVFAFFLIFMALLYRRSWLKILALQPLVWIGSISYPLYLLHQNIGVALIVEFAEGGDKLRTWAVLSLIIAGVSGAAWIVSALVERPLLNVAKSNKKQRARGAES